MKPVYWKLIGLAEVGIVAAYYNLFTNMGSISTNPAISWPYRVKINDLIYLDPTSRILGYLVLIALTLLILFADKLQFTQKVERSVIASKSEQSVLEGN